MGALALGLEMKRNLKVVEGRAIFGAGWVHEGRRGLCPARELQGWLLTCSGTLPSLQRAGETGQSLQSGGADGSVTNGRCTLELEINKQNPYTVQTVSFLHRRNTNEPDQEMGFYLFRVSRTPLIIVAGEEPDDVISCELTIAENTRLMEFKWHRHRQSTGFLQGSGRRPATVLGTVLHHGFCYNCDKHAQCCAEILKADMDTSVLKVHDPVLQTSINVLGLIRLGIGR